MTAFPSEGSDIRCQVIASEKEPRRILGQSLLFFFLPSRTGVGRGEEFRGEE